ncbi:MAG: type II toxin-antitoxin system HicA family toxin [Candidatus Pacearchaeota archaeon]
MELPLITAKKLIKFLKKEGFQFIRQKESHAFYRNPDGRTTVVPIHSVRKIKIGLLKGILNEIKVSREYFLKNIK